MAWSGQPADYRDDELDLVDDYDPEVDLLDDLDSGLRIDRAATALRRRLRDTKPIKLP